MWYNKCKDSIEVLQRVWYPSQRATPRQTAKDPEIRKQELHQEWLESGERGDIERRFGIGKRCYSLGRVTAKLKHTSEVMIHLSVLTLNLRKRLRLLLRFFCAYFRRIQTA